MRRRVSEAGWTFRPHVKTCKSVDVARRCFSPQATGPITVSTIREAEYFAEAGYTDILFAVSIVPDKLPRIIKLLKRQVRVQVLLDDASVAAKVAIVAAEANVQLPVWIEVDCDGHRAGIPMNRKSDAIKLAGQIHDSPGVQLAGVITHAGESYTCSSLTELSVAAVQEQQCLAAMADAIVDQGMACPGRSIGSSPTGLASTLETSQLETSQLETSTHKTDKPDTGITELRAGVFMFQDLFQANLCVCGIDDLAVSVLTTVISHRRDLNWLIVDAGGLALSKDRGTAGQTIDYGFGLPCQLDGRPMHGHVVVSANQEHGIISRNDGDIDFEAHPIGSRLRILPNHVCMTAAAHDGYHVSQKDGLDFWPRVNG